MNIQNLKKRYVDRISDYYTNGIKNVKRAISIRDNIINSANNMIPKDVLSSYINEISKDMKKEKNGIQLRKSL